MSLAESCPHLAIAGTAYYALGLVATTSPGSEVGHHYSHPHVTPHSRVCRLWVAMAGPLSATPEDRPGLLPLTGCS